MGSAVARVRARQLALLAASCVAVCAINAPEARAVANPLPGCPGSNFQYAGEFRFPPAPEGFTPDCTLRVGALTIEADAGRPDVNIGLLGLGVMVDDRGRLAHFNLPSGPLFDVARRGRPIGSVADSTTHFAFTYNRAGRLRKVVSTSSGAITLSYNSAGLVTKLDLGSGDTESFRYDSSGRVVSYSDSGGDSGSFTYSAGHLSSAAITLTAVDPSFGFTYNSGGTLASWSQTDTITQTSDLAVDSAGDVTTVTQGTTTEAALTYAGPHVLSKVTGNGGGTLASFTYDSNRRLSAANAGSASTTSFLYDSSGRLSSATYPTGPSSTVTSTLTYDSLGRLVRFGVSGGERITLVYVPAPAARTKTASNVGKMTATLNGAVNPHGLPADYRFQFGKTQNYGHSTHVRFAGNGELPVAVAASVEHLAPETTYHYRLIATTAAGTTIGTDRSLRTK